MKKEIWLKKCLKCGAIVKVLEDCKCSCGFECCGEKMQTLVPNSVDAAVEKHVPTYEIKNDKIFIKVNHVMEDEHFIEWVSVVFENKEIITYFKPGEEAVLECEYVTGSTVYAYCNKHGLWKADVK